MKYFILIWSGLWRKKTRTVFTMLSIIIAFLLFGILQGINLGMDSVINNLDADRLFVSNKYSMVEGMPLAHANQIRSIDGVERISHMTFFGGFFQEAKNAIPVFATDAPNLFKMYDEVLVEPGVLERMERTRNGAMLGKPVADRFGWKVGDVVPIGTSIWTKKDGGSDYQVEIVGIYESDAPAAGGIVNSFFINYDYFDEARQFGNGAVHYMLVNINDPLRGAEIASEIDALFANSPNETTTQTEQAMAASQINQVADIGFIVNAIVGAVLFTLLFLTGNTMMQSMRERIPELAILKTLGFSDAKVSLFVMCESVLLCVFAALVGLGLAAYLFTFVANVLGAISMPLSVVAIGVGMAVLLALISGAPPTWRTQRLNIVDALAGR